MNLASVIKFRVSGVEHTVNAEDVTPETTLNTYLREKLHLTGTKRMCLEGGCGTCVVAVEQTVNNKTRIFAVNSCLVSIFSCQGWTIHTVEEIGGPTTTYHPIQQLLANGNGTQCGFCSPGMVMNMYALHESGPKTQQEIEDAFSGNICRCTGYRPILSAFRTLASDADEKAIAKYGDIEDLKPCKNGKKCETPCEVACEKGGKLSFYYQVGDTKWIKVYAISDILKIWRTSCVSTYMLVAGNTARGVYRHPPIPDIYIDVTSVTVLTTYTLSGNSLELGGNLNLANVIEIFTTVSKQNANFAYLAQLAEHIGLVANVSVRNIGTLAGNLMIKHLHNEFPSDIFLILETCNATLVLVDINEKEIKVSPKDFLNLHMDKKIIKSIILTGFDTSYKYVSYKIMARAQNTHALVNAGFLLQLSSTTVISARIIYGGINPQFIHATNTETSLVGKNLFDNAVLLEALEALNFELTPDYIPPDTKPEFRKSLAVSLFYKFVLSIAPATTVSPRNVSGGSLIVRPLSNGTQQYTPDTEYTPVGKPIIKVEALAQTSGQAEYIADVPDLPNQLYAALVTAKADAHSVILNIDATRALAVTGVVAFYGKDDIPGENTFSPAIGGFVVQEELFCSGTVQYYDQTIGVIVANSHVVAEKAAALVDVVYSAPITKPYLNVQQVLAANDKTRIHPQSTILPKSKGTDVTHVIKGSFDVGWQYHFHMEVQCCNVVPTEDSLDLYPSTQWMDLAQIAASAALNIPTHKINVRVRRLGGAYGAKITRNALISTAAALAAHKLRKPVKIWMPLEKNMEVIGKRFPLSTPYEVGVNDKGVIQYLNADLYSDFGVGGNEVIDSLIISMFENCYDISTWSFSTYTVTTDTHANCWTRAPGTLEGLGCIESIMEHIGATLNLDASVVKQANIDTVNYPKVIEFWNDMQTWANIPARQANIKTYNQANRWKKRGMSIVPMSWALEIQSNFTVLVSIFHGDGGVVVSHGGVEIGQGINTKVVQVCAYKFGIDVDLVSVKPSYNVIAPNSFATGGSVTSEGVCYAVTRACDVLLGRMKPIRDKMGNPTWVALVNECYISQIHLSSSGYYSINEPNVQEYDIYGVCATEVEVDILTGQHQIVRVDIIEDLGESMNPLIDIGQVEGAFVMGIGYYCTEEIKFNDHGKLLTNRTWNYLPPGAKDIPINFNIKFPSNNPNPVGVLKSKAVAEPPICISCSVPLAIRNAVGAARAEADPTQPKWYPFNGTSTVENTHLNCLNNYKQYVL